MENVCFEKLGKFAQVCACEPLPTSLLKLRNLVVSKFSLWVCLTSCHSMLSPVRTLQNIWIPNLW